MKKVVIIGAGGFGREVYNALQVKNQIASESDKCDCIGFLDDNVNALKGFETYPQVIGTISNATLDSDLEYVLGVGIPRIRRKIALKFKDDWNLFPAVWTLTSNLIGSSRPIGISVARGAFVHGKLSVDVSVGKFALINYSYSIGHDVQIGDFCELAPNCVISGGVKLEEGVFVGSGAIIGPQVVIGAWSKISAGAVVLNNVPPYSFVESPRCKVHRDFFLP